MCDDEFKPNDVNNDKDETAYYSKLIILWVKIHSKQRSDP